jgi:hypothetical protein
MTVFSPLPIVDLAALPAIGVRPDGTPAVVRARALIEELKAIEYEARLINGALYLADVSSNDRSIPGRRKLPWLRRIAFRRPQRRPRRRPSAHRPLEGKREWLTCPRSPTWSSR